MKESELNAAGNAGAVVPETLFGCSVGHTRACLFGGLSAQMLRNRKFTGIPSAGCGCVEIKKGLTAKLMRQPFRERRRIWVQETVISLPCA